MAFKIIFTDGGRKSLDHAVDYLLYGLENPSAAKKFYEDFLETIARLKVNAVSYSIVDDYSNPEISNLRKIHLQKYKYKVFYEVIGGSVYIKAVLHDKQDAGKIFE